MSRPWNDDDQRNLVITTAGTLVANLATLATLVVIFGGLALVKHVEQCPTGQPVSSCPVWDLTPIWPLVWGLTGGVALAAVLFFTGRRMRINLPKVYRWEPDAPLPRRRLPFVLRFFADSFDWLDQLLRLPSRPAPGTEPTLIYADEAQQMKWTAVGLQGIAVLYVLGWVVMWIGIVNGGRPG